MAVGRGWERRIPLLAFAPAKHAVVQWRPFLFPGILRSRSLPHLLRSGLRLRVSIVARHVLPMNLKFQILNLKF